MHDVGLAAIPSYSLSKPTQRLSPSEQELLRAHPYRAERIFARVPALTKIVPLVAAHHERMDGRGFYRGLSGEQVPIGARIIAVADRFDELSHASPNHDALDQQTAFNDVRADTGPGLWPPAVEALAEELGAARARSPHRRSAAQPAGLTEREIEILRMLSRGLTRQEIARQTVISEHTVRHHLEHIYDKVGVSTRVAAALFAAEHGLLD
jgi:HD-GYP domain-containing protein (c-di-GMP phosphodiesterase class II)